MSNVKVSALTALTTVDDLDLLVVVDADVSTSKKSTKAQFLGTVLSATTASYTTANATVVGNTSNTNTGDEVAANLTTAGVVEIATVAETNTGTDATRAVSPAGLTGWTGDTGVVTVGTIATGVWQGTAINATYLDGQSGTNTGDEVASSLTVAGVVELATVAETNTGTDALRAVTPAGLTAWTGDTGIVTVGTIATGTWQGTAINQTYLTGQSGTNTGDETLSSVNALAITTVGTINTGVWNSTAVTVPNGGTGATTLTDARTSLGLAIGSDVQAYDADTLKADTTDTLTAGFDTTIVDAGTKSSATFTPAATSGNLQRFVNGGAHTLAPMANNGTMILHQTNNVSAGTITTSGFTLVDGDDFTTTNTHEFILYLTKIHDVSLLTVKALQ